MLIHLNENFNKNLGIQSGILILREVHQEVKLNQSPTLKYTKVGPKYVSIHIVKNKQKSKIASTTTDNN